VDGALLQIFRRLTGHDPRRLDSAALAKASELLATGGSGLGLSQMNETLLLLGYDRISESLFQYLVDGKLIYEPGACIESLTNLQDATSRFRKLALVWCGNVKYAFKNCARSEEFLQNLVELDAPKAVDRFSSRHERVQSIEEIAPADTPLLGYLSSRLLEQRLKDAPDDPALLAEFARQQEARRRGRRNFDISVTSDHLDVYVATSMREPHEFLLVHWLSNEIFAREDLQKLKVRWFDPTLAFCDDRIDKGLSESLMLKRAKCTLYFVQENDTLGKDSELACTLAQGKPVVAFVPAVTREYFEKYLDLVTAAYRGESVSDVLLRQLRLFEPDGAWTDPWIRSLLDNGPAATDESRLKDRLFLAVQNHYEKRANVLKNDHPLGLQVNLQTGVANGVLVARTAQECATLLSRCITGTLEFDLEEPIPESGGHLLLRERITQSVFRVMTSNELLTNAFWNFYLRPEEL
jgi:hypothetical protein